MSNTDLFTLFEILEKFEKLFEKIIFQFKTSQYKFFNKSWVIQYSVNKYVLYSETQSSFHNYLDLE